MQQGKAIIKNYLETNCIDYECNIALQRITKINGGGNCSFYCVPSSSEKLEKLLSFCISHELVVEVIGNATNIYFLKNYNPTIVITTTKVNEIVADDNYLNCSCGVNLTKISRYCVNHGIAGYEGFVGIPGTLGGAVVNNSGAFESVISQITKSVKVLTSKNKIKELTNEELKYTHRNSVLKTGELQAYILSVKIDVSKKEEIRKLKEKVVWNTKYRKRIVDGKRISLGSVFVSSSLDNLHDIYKYRLFLKKIIFAPFRLLIRDSQRLNKINTWLYFFFLGVPQLSKHCDSINRFCWDSKTKDSDFIDYIKTMQSLSKDKLELEIELKGSEK